MHSMKDVFVEGPFSNLLRKQDAERKPTAADRMKQFADRQSDWGIAPGEEWDLHDHPLASDPSTTPSEDEVALSFSDLNAIARALADTSQNDPSLQNTYAKILQRLASAEANRNHKGMGDSYGGVLGINPPAKASNQESDVEDDDNTPAQSSEDDYKRKLERQVGNLQYRIIALRYLDKLNDLSPANRGAGAHSRTLKDGRVEVYYPDKAGENRPWKVIIDPKTGKLTKKMKEVSFVAQQRAQKQAQGKPAAKSGAAATPAEQQKAQDDLNMRIKVAARKSNPNVPLDFKRLSKKAGPDGSVTYFFDHPHAENKVIVTKDGKIQVFGVEPKAAPEEKPVEVPPAAAQPEPEIPDADVEEPEAEIPEPDVDEPEVDVPEPDVEELPVEPNRVPDPDDVEDDDGVAEDDDDGEQDVPMKIKDEDLKQGLQRANGFKDQDFELYRKDSGDKILVIPTRDGELAPLTTKFFSYDKQTGKWNVENLDIWDDGRFSIVDTSPTAKKLAAARRGTK